MYTGPAVQVQFLGCGVTLGTVGMRHKMQCLEKRLTLRSVNVCPNVYDLGGGHHGDCGHTTSGQGIGSEVTLGIVDRLP